MKATDYRWMEVWGREMGSNTDYTRREQERAATVKAPATTIFLRDNNGQVEPHVVEDITNAMTLHSLRRLAVERGLDTAPLRVAERRIEQARPGWELTHASECVERAIRYAEEIGDQHTALAARVVLDHLAAAIVVRVDHVVEVPAS